MNNRITDWSTSTVILRHKSKVHNRAKAPNPLRIDPTRTAGLRRKLMARVKKQFALLKGKLVKLVLDEDALGLRPQKPFTFNEAPQYLAAGDPRTLSWEERRDLLPAQCRVLDWVLDVRQRDHFSCGACATKAVGDGLGVRDMGLDDYKQELGTDEEESTRPSAIVEFFERRGFQVAEKHGMTLDDLRYSVSRNMPVIVCVQDYGPAIPGKAKFDYGHYLTVIGVVDGGDGYVLCQDSSEDNVVAGSDSAELSETGSVQKPGRIRIAQDDFS